VETGGAAEPAHLCATGVIALDTLLENVPMWRMVAWSAAAAEEVTVSATDVTELATLLASAQSLMVAVTIAAAVIVAEAGTMVAAPSATNVTDLDTWHVIVVKRRTDVTDVMVLDTLPEIANKKRTLAIIAIRLDTS